MSDVKEIFSKGINYILRDIKDNEDCYNTGLEYLNKVQSKLTVHQKQTYINQIEKIKADLQEIKENIKKHKKELKFYLEYYHYTESDFTRLNLHPATDEEIKADYEKDEKEKGYDLVKGKGRYTKEEHEELIKRVNEFNKMNNLPLVNW